MKTPRRPDSLPAPEAAALRAEAGRLTADMLRALDALEEPEAGESADAPAEIPPLPGPLRARWEEAYGAPAGRDAAPDGMAASWIRRLRATLSSGRMVAGAAVAAAACVAVAVFADFGGQDPVAGGTAPAITRGPGAPVSTPSVIRLVVVAAPESGEALLATLQQAFPGRPIDRVDTRAPASADAFADAVVIDPAAGTATWPDGHAAPLAGNALADPSLAVAAVEDFDEAARRKADR